jgi:membrane protein DedA with SNARE-associated domain
VVAQPHRRDRDRPFHLEEKHLARMDRWFAVHGEATVALARCVPVVRAYISYPAGTARMDARWFGLYTFLGSLPFTLALVYAGILLGKHWRVVEYDFHFLDYAVYALLIALAVYVVVRLLERSGGNAPAPPPTPPA